MNPSYHDIEVQTELEYGGYESKQRFYVHKYQITIINRSDINFQLLSRKWIISDGLAWNKTVEGDGVIGQQPIIRSGESYSYSSWCPMPSTAGLMYGHFNCIDLDNQNRPFKVDVPQMNFVATELLN